MELIIKTSIIDFIGETQGGVSILIGLTIEDSYSFESIYWLHPNGDITYEAEENFLKLFGVGETEKLPFLKELIEDIEHILPEKEEIFKEYNLIE